MLLKPGLERAQVDRCGLLVKVEHRLEEELVPLEVEVGWYQPSSGGGARGRIDRHGAEDGPLGFE